MVPPDRRPQWRQAVYAPRPGMTNSCRLILLYMGEHMNAKRIMSRPRAKLAADLGVAPARISEAVKLAKELGFLSVVREARPGVTAVYQGLIPRPPEVRPSYPDEPELEVRPPGHHGVRDTYLKTGSRGTHVPHPSSGNETQASSPTTRLPSSQAKGAMRMTKPSRCEHGVPNGTVPDPWKDGRPVCDACSQAQSELEAS